MNAHAPPKKAPGALASFTGRKLIDVPRAYHGPGLVQRGIIWKRWELRLAYRCLDNVQRPFAWLFCLIEQRKAWIDVELERLAP
jgi:hypothetical protein